MVQQHFSTLFQVGGFLFFSSVLQNILKQHGKETEAQVLGIVSATVTMLIVLSLLNEMFRTIRTTFMLY